MRLTALDVPAAADTLLYTVPADTRLIATLNLCNRATLSAGAKVRVALTAGAAPVAADWIEYDAPLPPSGNPGGSTLERTGIALKAADRIYVRADVVGVSAVLFGLTDAV